VGLSVHGPVIVRLRIAMGSVVFDFVIQKSSCIYNRSSPPVTSRLSHR
jgi:hypothetical protein